MYYEVNNTGGAEFPGFGGTTVGDRSVDVTVCDACRNCFPYKRKEYITKSLSRSTTALL